GRALAAAPRRTPAPRTSVSAASSEVLLNPAAFLPLARFADLRPVAVRAGNRHGTRQDRGMHQAGGAFALARTVRAIRRKRTAIDAGDGDRRGHALAARTANEWHKGLPVEPAESCDARSATIAANGRTLGRALCRSRLLVSDNLNLGQLTFVAIRSEPRHVRRCRTRSQCLPGTLRSLRMIPLMSPTRPH